MFAPQLLTDGAAGAPSWMTEAVFWLAVASLVTLVVGAAGVWTLVVRLRELREESHRLTTLDELDQKLGKLVADRGDLDLRRIEHVLIDLRDHQERLEDALLRALEASRGGVADGRDVLVPARPESVGERVTNRLLALGYERVQLITRREKLAELSARDGEVLVEARREGVLYKGRVLLRNGRLSEVELNPAYSIFP